jgi:SAM-dependent methyltransferase
MSENELRFGFGKNWENYLKEHFSEERVQISKEHLLNFLKLNDLTGRYFLDIGCGSGLHSLAAFRAGAAKVVSFDYDPHSVLATQMLKKYAGNPENWEVKQGSILDEQFLSALEPADVVYSWGVLHHTGSMWQAVQNTKDLMKSDALLYIALYDDGLYFDLPKSYWSEVKKRYNQANWIGKKRKEFWYIWQFYLQKKLSKLPDLVKQAREYKKSRGMDLYRDAVDWLGGWPFEYASVEEVKSFVSEHIGLELINLTTGQACAEYLFKYPRK